MTPYFDNGVVQLYNADCCDMSFLPGHSVDCVVTSPPYWGLRDYGLPPSIWDGAPVCEHEWGALRKGKTQSGSLLGSTLDGAHSGKERRPEWESVYCHHCGAWRGTLGLEPTPEMYVQHLVEIFREVWRVLKPSGTAWVNLGDSYASGMRSSYDDDRHKYKTARAHDMRPPSPPGLKSKDMVGIPWRVAFALQADGWYLRSDIIWSKPNPMPESVTDRPTKAHEYLFLLTKAERYYYDQEAVREPIVDYEAGHRRREAENGLNHKFTLKVEGQPHEPSNKSTLNSVSVRASQQGRNRRSVWTIPTQPFPEAHFATFPEALVEPCVLAGTSERGNCPECGKPWERVVEKSGGAIGDSYHDHDDDLGQGQRAENRAKGGYGYKVETIGWRPTCSCDKEPVPAIVLDPFAGSGTVGAVAQRLGRKAVLVEASAEYCGLAAKRLAAVPLPLMEVTK